MKRSGFALKPYQRPPRAPLVPVTRQVNSGPSVREAAPVPKDEPVRSEAYRRWVASLQCAHCKRMGPSQCAHSDEGKGLALKAGDDTCYPLCADSPSRRGCHTLIGASGVFSREQRRELEKVYSARTRLHALALDAFPKEWL